MLECVARVTHSSTKLPKRMCLLRRVPSVYHVSQITGVLVKMLSASWCYRRVALVSMSLETPIQGRAIGDFVMIRLDERDLSDMERLRLEVPCDVMRQRFERGDVCFGARLGNGDLICMTWAATGEAHLPYLRATIHPRGGQVYLYDAYTCPKHRGRGVIALVTGSVHEHFRRLGYETALAAALPENDASHRYLTRLGYREYGRFGFVGVGPWRRYFGEPLP